MDTTLRGKIEDVKLKSLNDGREMFLVTINGYETSTMKRDIAAAAKTLIGREVVAAITEKQNGQWMNRYLNALEVVTGQTSVAPTAHREETIKRSFAVKSAIALLPHFGEDERTWTTVKTVAPMIYDFVSDDSEWVESPDVEPQPTDDIPF